MTAESGPRAGPSSTDDARWPRAAQWLAGGRPPFGGGPVDLAFLGVPAYRTSLSPTGACATPGAVRRALQRYSTYSWRHGLALEDVVTPFDLGDVVDPDDDEGRTMARARDGAGAARLLLACGGDNSITYAVMRGVAGDDLARAGLVTLDAHHDLRDGVSNGSPVRRLVEAGLNGRRVVQIGIADWANSGFYAERARRLGITVVPREELSTRPVSEILREAIDLAGAAGGPVYVDLDVDVCDRAVAPACPASLPGGIPAGALRAAAYAAGADPRVVALDIAEVDAEADAPDGRTVRLAALCVLDAAAGLAARRRSAAP